jgi:hypothetical protein
VFNHLDEKQQPVYDVLCRIELYPNTHTLFAGSSHRENVIAEFYDHGEFYNWSPVYLAAHLGVVEADLKKKFRSSLFAEVRDPSLTRLLLKDTLYIMDTEFKSFNKFSAREKKSDLNFDRYGAPYRLCSPRNYFKFLKLKRGDVFSYPFNESETIKLVSFRYHRHNYPFKNDSLITDSLIEQNTLNKTEVNSLTDIFYNNFYKRTSGIGSETMCFFPRNAILFN